MLKALLLVGNFLKTLITSVVDFYFFRGEKIMSQMAMKISKLDNKKLLDLLNVAFAEEWLAYYQYWIGAHLAEGVLRHAVVKEFEEHAAEELEHAEKLAKRIAELGGTPLTNPNMFEKVAECKYEEPKNLHVSILLQQNLASERCAVARYQQICEMTFGKDYETFKMSAKILKDEIEHEQEMEDFLADYNAGIEHSGEKIDDPADKK